MKFTGYRYLHLQLGGGRSSNAGFSATVFGSTGFLGRYVVNALGKIGARVVIPYRGEEMGYAHLKPMGDLGQIYPVWFSIRDKDSIRHAVEKSDVVINLIGKPWHTKNFRMQEIHVDAARAIADACREAGVERLVHVSALGATTASKSEFSSSKALGEVAVREAFPEATILRPAPVFGFQDRLLRKYGHIGRFWPAFPLLHDDSTRLQPLWSNDFAAAVLRAVAQPEAAGKTYELGGPNVYTQRELLEYVRDALMMPSKWIVPVPPDLAMQVARFFERFARNPKFVADEIQYYRDSRLYVDGSTPSLRDLGIEHPGSMEVVATSSFLRLYRKPSFLNLETN